jgi:SNF family Na+-dependent transporter
MTASLTTPGIIFMISIWLIIIGFLIYSFSRVLLKKRVRAVKALSGIARERWGSRVGLIMAMAGNAIGLGNFLRFPVKAAANGGGAFLIPYFAALVLLGIPLMWVEWTIGRYGGKQGHGTMPGMLSSMWKSKYAKYVGTIGLMIPFIIVVYYTFIESWTLGYSCISPGNAVYLGISGGI